MDTERAKTVARIMQLTDVFTIEYLTGLQETMEHAARSVLPGVRLPEPPTSVVGGQEDHDCGH